MLQKKVRFLKYLYIFLLSIFVTSCFRQNTFTISSSNELKFEKFQILIQKGVYSNSFLDMTVRIFVKKNESLINFFDETKNGVVIDSIKFNVLKLPNKIAIYNKNIEFYYFLFRENGDIISIFPFKKFKVQNLSINEQAQEIRVVGIRNGKLKKAHSLNLGETWVLQ